MYRLQQNYFHIKFNAISNPSKYRQKYYIFSGKIIIQIPYSVNPINLLHDTLFFFFFFSFPFLPQNKTEKNPVNIEICCLILVIWQLADK